MLFIWILITCLCIVTAVIPAWWFTGRIQCKDTSPCFRLVCAIGIALVSYLSFVNLVGRTLGQSTSVAGFYLLATGVATIVLMRRCPTEVSIKPLLPWRRDLLSVLLIAMIVGFPQWLLAISTPFWDEVASSAIHITAPSQFAENLFPPRHNALPDISIKYHYGFTLLSGTLVWLAGLSPNAAIDVASTALWSFAFLFIVYWLRDLKLGLVPGLWGGVAALVGGGLSWAYARRIEGYSEFEVTPNPAFLVHRFDEAKSFFANLVDAAKVPSAFLRNADGSLSNLPWDIAAQFQQHAVALGIALTPLAFYLFTRWQSRTGSAWLLGIMTVMVFGLLPLGHAVFGAVAAVTAGLVLLVQWLRRPTRERFIDGIFFGVSVVLLALAHGGLLASGPQYGSDANMLTARDTFGYSRGGWTGFLHWNIAGFGIPLLAAVALWIGLLSRWAVRRKGTALRDTPLGDSGKIVLFCITIYTLVSYFVPHLAFYSSDTYRVEQFTEISKFFFPARFGFALLSAFAVAYLGKRVLVAVVVAGCLAMTIGPLAFVYAHSTEEYPLISALQPHEASPPSTARRWLGFYQSPYVRSPIQQQMATRVRALKTNNHNTYFDASGDERIGGYLHEMLTLSGSIFTLTPSRYERTGVGYRLSDGVVSKRFIANSRMARLRPGAPEEADCQWYYARPEQDMALAPTIVKARLDKLISEEYFVDELSAGQRQLFAIRKPTTDLDKMIHLFWSPRFVRQASSDWDGDGTSDLIFYDFERHKVLVRLQKQARRSTASALQKHSSRGFAEQQITIDLPEVLRDEFATPFLGKFPGDARVDLLFGRMQDTVFRFGRRIEDIVEFSPWSWSFRNTASDAWAPEYPRWLWDGDIPLVADFDNDGFDNHFVYRSRSGEWIQASGQKLAGPAMPLAEAPLPFVGRFSRSSTGDLALWAQKKSSFSIQTIATGARIDFQWGTGTPTDVLVPGDYDGDGIDELAIFNRDNQFWYWRKVSDGAITQIQFGSPTAVPVPADYDGDGRLDPAYWEPVKNAIYVTFTKGKTIDLVIPTPPNSIPIFVTMF